MQYIPIKYTSPQELMDNCVVGIINIEVLKTSFKLGIFEILKSGYKSVKELKNILDFKASSRNLYDFFDKLVLFGLLERQGIEETALYRNTQSTNTLFLKESPHNILCLYDLAIHLQQSFFNLDQYLKNGSLNMNKNSFSKWLNTKESARSYLYSMKHKNEKNFDLTIENLPSLKDYKTIIDVGGALSVFSCKLKTKFPELHCISMDLPLVTELAKEYLNDKDLLGKVELFDGDFFQDKWPKGDVIFFCHILLDWNYENKITLLKKAYDSINEGGMLVCEEEYIDDKREKDTKGLNSSLIMLTQEVGYNCTHREFDGLARSVGFKKTEYFDSEVEFCIAYKC